MSILLLVQLSQPGSNLWTHVSISFGIPYWSISIALNVIVTLLIVGRLVYWRRKISFIQSSNLYTSIITMLVESAALYTIFALIFVISYALNSMVQNVLLPVLGHIQVSKAIHRHCKARII